MTKRQLIDTNDLPTIALIGRVNVGKSSLFNRLIEEQKAIISDVPGTTRTNNEGLILWRGKYIKLIDTGGLSFDEENQFEEDIIRQSEYAMKHSNIIVFVTDATTGILPLERELAKRLRKTQKPIVVVANKADSSKIVNKMITSDWKALGFGEPILISAASGRNTGDFLDEIYNKLLDLNIKNFNEELIIPPAIEAVQVALIGKPNAGKSSLFNKLIGEEKVIVSEIAHTTREPHDTLIEFQYEEDGEEKTQSFNFVDTAGIRRKSRVDGAIEKEGVHKSIESIDSSDIILFVIDGKAEISHQDMQLGGLLESHARSVVILVNKWDLSEDNTDEYRNNVRAMVYSHFPHLSFAPIIFVSGKTGYKVHQIMPTLLNVWKARQLNISEGKLRDFLKRITKEHRPSRGKGIRHPELVGMRQIGIKPPVFEVFVKYRTSLHPSYLNFIENKLREEFDLIGTPVIIKLTKMKRY